MKRIINFLFLLQLILFLFLPSLSFAQLSYNKFIFFGDSLSDNGNLYKAMSKLIPRSPPYYNGRFSNGETWAELIGEQSKNSKGYDYKIYAAGGATASPIFLNINTFDLQVTQYLFDSMTTHKKDTLFFVWIGANDYLYDYIIDVDFLTSEVINSIFWSLKRLLLQGAENFIILNLPDLAKAPIINKLDLEERLHQLTILHNQKLNALINDLAAKNPNAKFQYIDVYTAFNDSLDHLDQSNKKYHTHIKNTTEACLWGIFISPSQDKQLRHNLVKLLKSNSLGAHIEKSLQSLILSETVALTHAYEKGFVKSCANPDDYFFWDFIHPTAVGHKIIAQMVLEKMYQ